MALVSTRLFFADGAQTILWHNPCAPQQVIRDFYIEISAYASSGIASDYLLAEVRCTQAFAKRVNLCYSCIYNVSLTTQTRKHHESFQNNAGAGGEEVSAREDHI